MATLTAYEAFDSGEVSDSADGGRSYVRTFVVDTGGLVLTGDEVLAADGLPVPGSPYVDELGGVNPTAVCESRTATPDPQDRTTWRVRAAYSTRLAAEVAESTGVSGPGGTANVVGPLAGGPPNPAAPAASGGEGGGGGGGGGGESLAPPTLIENPLLRPAKWSLRSRWYTKIPEKDLDNVKVLNSAGDPFDPPVSVERPAAVLTVLKNLPLERITLDSYTDWLDAVNSETWLGKPAKTWRVADLEVDPAYENGVWFLATRWVFEHNPLVWDPYRVLNAGWRERVFEAGEFRQKAIVDFQLRQPNSVPLLASDGSPLEVDAEPTYRSFRLRLAMRFQIFGLFGEE